MLLATFNCNSLRARLDMVLDWLVERAPDILCLQETKVQDKEFPEVDFQKIGYYSYHVGQKAYNGVAILSKEPSDLLETQLSSDPNKEARFIKIKYKGITVVNAYVPQGTAVGSERFSYKLSFLDGLLEHLKEKHLPSDLLVLAGDLNVALTDKDVYDPKAFEGKVCFHPEEKKRILDILEWGLVDVFRLKYPDLVQYTFWDYRIPNSFKRNLGWRLDYILSTPPMAHRCLDIKVDTIPRSRPRPSDHTFLWANFDI